MDFFPNKHFRASMLVASLAFSQGCPAGDPNENPDLTISSALFDGPESAALGVTGNESRCITCHSAGDDSATIFPGNSMKDIAYRTAFKGGDAPTLLDGANACITGWMAGTALTADSAEWNELEAYLQSISDESVTEPNGLAPEVKANLAAYEADYAGGDAVAGAAAYQNACGACHNAALTVGPAPAPSVTDMSTLAIGYIAQKVRTSGPPPSSMEGGADTFPGPMPFFEPKELDAATLADIIAHIRAGG